MTEVRRLFYEIAFLDVYRSVVETDRHGEETFTIVGSAEADAAAGKISFTSPIGRALMGRHEGETVRIQVPAGALDFRIVKVR